MAVVNIDLTLISFETIWTLASEGRNAIRTSSIVQARHCGAVVDVHMTDSACET